MTTISQHGETMGQTAAEILIDKLENKTKEVVTKVIKTDLVIRDSTR
jgi:LacI family transcriptional regulator